MRSIDRNHVSLETLFYHYAMLLVPLSLPPYENNFIKSLHLLHFYNINFTSGSDLFPSIVRNSRTQSADPESDKFGSTTGNNFFKSTKI